ncbi:MAG: GIN domain-containing protein [Acidimicrobiia bacterium]
MRKRKDTSRLLLVVLVLMALMTFAGCDVPGVEGSGNLVTERREVGSFIGIEVRGGANVELEVDPGLSQSVSVTYDDNLLDNIVTRLEGNTLIVDTEGSFRTTGGTRRFVTVTTDHIEAITTSGGADVTGQGVTESYRLEASGGSDVDLLDLRASSVEIDTSGGTDVLVFASESITGEASGGSDVSVFGSPATFSVSSSGGADVNLRD